MFTEDLLKHKKILITGAARGIGAAIARQAAALGAQVGINYHHSELAARVLVTEIKTAGGEALAVQADVSSFQEVEDMFAHFESVWGTVDCLVNNAGVDLRALITETSRQQWQLVMDTDMGGAFLCVSRALPGMLRQHYGRIINIASIFAATGAAYESAYAAAKGALVNFTKSVAAEAGRGGITANAIAPGPILTDMLASELTAGELQELADAIPVGRLGKPEEIAACCIYLLSPEAGFINGAVINMDGGWKLY